LLQGDPDVADPAQVIADQLVEAVSLIFVDGRRGAGHGALLFGGTPKAAAMPRREYFGE